MIIELTSELGYSTYSKRCQKIFDKFSREVGWVVFNKDLQKEIRSSKSRLLISVDSITDEIYGSLLCYKRKDGVTKIVAIAVLKEHQCKGFGKGLIDYLHTDRIEVSCLDDIDANHFYKSLNFKLYSTKLSRKGNKINIYRNYE